MPQTVTQAVYASDYTSLGMGVGEGVNMCGRRDRDELLKKPKV